MTARVWTFDAVVDAPQAAVFNALSADPSTWTWFPGFSAGAYEGDAPHGVGTKRWIRLSRTTYRETIVAWERPTRWAYRVDKSTVPLAHSLIEEWRVHPTNHDTQSRVTWIFTIQPRPLFRAFAPIAPPVMRALFRRAMGNLSRHLAHGT